MIHNPDGKGAWCVSRSWCGHLAETMKAESLGKAKILSKMEEVNRRPRGMAVSISKVPRRDSRFWGLVSETPEPRGNSVRV